MTEEEIRKSIRILLASLNAKYPKTPLIKWMDLEDVIVHLVRTASKPGDADTKK